MIIFIGNTACCLDTKSIIIFEGFFIEKVLFSMNLGVSLSAAAAINDH